MSFILGGSSSQIYVDCLYSESTIPNSIKYQAVQFYQRLLRAEEEIVRIRNEMLNCVHHYIGAHECLVRQVECYKRSEDDQLGKICLLKIPSAKCIIICSLSNVLVNTQI